jgi:hypothetical protein
LGQLQSARVAESGNAPDLRSGARKGSGVQIPSLAWAFSKKAQGKTDVFAEAFFKSFLGKKKLWEALRHALG